MPEPYSQLPPGMWRGTLYLDPDKALSQMVSRETSVHEQLPFDEVSEGELPFNFHLTYESDESFYIELINAEERIRLDSITINHDPATNKDTVLIALLPFDSYIEAIFEDNVLEGTCIMPSRGDYSVGFVAHHGESHRFTQLKKQPVADLSGKWEVYFEIETDEPFPAIAEFRQEGNRLTGTFLTETGDYRYLEGTVQEDKMYLSCFDGAHLFLFEAKIMSDGSLSGIFRSGVHYITSWQASRDDDFALADPDSLTFLRDPGTRLAFSFPDQEGKITSLDDEAFAGRPKVIQILGTWCPNCLDETRFLVDYAKGAPKDLVIVGLAFERLKEPAQARSRIARYRERLRVPYPILHAGLSSKEEAAKQLPMLNDIISFPTLIFLNRRNEVVRIHTGFHGPATSEYQTFVKDFHATMEGLLAEI